MPDIAMWTNVMRKNNTVRLISAGSPQRAAKKWQKERYMDVRGGGVGGKGGSSVTEMPTHLSNFYRLTKKAKYGHR